MLGSHCRPVAAAAAAAAIFGHGACSGCWAGGDSGRCSSRMIRWLVVSSSKQQTRGSNATSKEGRGPGGKQQTSSSGTITSR